LLLASFGARLSIEDQPRPAIDTEDGLVSPRHRVLGLTAPLGPIALVHNAPTLRAMADRRIGPPVIHVVARGSVELFVHAAGLFCSSCDPTLQLNGRRAF